MDIIRIAYSDLCERVSAALVARGLPQASADIEAEVMAEADLLGTPSHGVRMLPGVLKALQDGRAATQAAPKVLRELPASCVVDFGNAPGRHASVVAMQYATERAQNYGVGICLAARTTHWGRAHAYAARAAQAGFIGVCTTNAIPTMAAFGASRPVIGNNPLAIGIPSQNPAEPIVLDMAMSQAAVGKVNTWLREGRTPPEGWGLDRHGNATNDPKEILAGAVLPMGGHKGSALAMMIELMTAALAGGLFGHEVVQNDATGLDPDCTKLFIALKVGAFVEPEIFKERVLALLAHLHDNASDREAFLWPSQRGWDERRRNLAEGVPLHREIVAQLRAAGVSLPS